MIAIGEASRQSGIGIETIRYYERKGIIPAASRAANGRRVYDDAAVRRLALLKKCRDLGFSLTDARFLVHLSDGASADCEKVRDTTLKQINGIRRKVGELQRLEAALLELSEHCAPGKAECPMLLELRGP